MTRCDRSTRQVDRLPGKTRSKTRLQLVELFFTKTTLFWIFFKIEIDPADPMTRSKPGTRVLDQAGFKNYDPCCIINKILN